MTVVTPIPFSGPGKYELANGQVVNLNEYMYCLESDGIKNSNGVVFNWLWCPDGTTLGIGVPDITQLYLVKKLESSPDHEHEYVMLDMEKYGHLMGRIGIDEFKPKINEKDGEWELIRIPQHSSMRSFAESDHKCKWRCKKEHLPILEDPEEIVEITDKNHIGRECDFLKLRSDGRWNPLQVSVGKILDSPIRYMYGCKRKDLPTECDYKVVDNKYTFSAVPDYSKQSFEKWNLCSDVDIKHVAGCDITLKKEEEEMKKETAVAATKGIAKFVGVWGFRALNYWVFEPATGIGKPIMKSVRYATFLGGLSACCYGYYHPEVVVNGIKSCLPKISIEAPSIMQGEKEV